MEGQKRQADKKRRQTGRIKTGLNDDIWKVKQDRQTNRRQVGEIKTESLADKQKTN